MASPSAAPDIASLASAALPGALWREIAPEWRWLLLGVVVLAAGAAVKGLQPTARERRHARYQARALQAISAIRDLDPIANPARAFGYLRAVNPYVFEEMVLTLLARRGLKIQRNRSYSGDGGVDGAFELHGQRWLIQAKRYRNAINPSHLAAFEAVCAQSGAYGMFIHTGRTGPSSRAFERAAAHVRIVSGRDLLALVAGEGFNLFGQGSGPQSPPGSAQIPRSSPAADVPDLMVTGRTNSRLRRR